MLRLTLLKEAYSSCQWIFSKGDLFQLCVGNSEDSTLCILYNPSGFQKCKLSYTPKCHQGAFYSCLYHSRLNL